MFTGSESGRALIVALRRAGAGGAGGDGVALDGPRGRLQIQRPPLSAARCSGCLAFVAGGRRASCNLADAGAEPDSAARAARRDVPRAGATGRQRLERRSRERRGQAVGAQLRRLRLAGAARPGRVGLRLANGQRVDQRLSAGILGWTLLAWAALRCPNGAPSFLRGARRVPAVARRDSRAAPALAVAAPAAAAMPPAATERRRAGRGRAAASAACCG